MGYTAQQLQAVKRQAERFAKEDPQGGKVRGTKQNGRMSLRVPQDAYFAAIENNGGVRKDGTNIWNDSEWVRDMKLRNPEICRGGAGVTFPPGVTRFGKASEHIVYPRTRALESASTSSAVSSSPSTRTSP